MQLRALIVEDNLDWQLIWNLVFEAFTDEFEMIWATSVAEALDRLREFGARGIRFDIIISDIFLSGSLTGFDLFEQLDQIDRTRFLFVSSVKPKKILASLRCDERELHILQKPFSLSAALAKLRNIHQSSDETYLM